MDEKEEQFDKFDEVFKKGIGKRMVFYMKNGQRMEGVLRGYDTVSVQFDAASGCVGGSAARRGDISSTSILPGSR